MFGPYQDATVTSQIKDVVGGSVYAIEVGGAVKVGCSRRPSKYRAVPTIVDGIRFDSKLEAGRYSQLRIMERSGEISLLTRQMVFQLMVRDVEIGAYVADFVYRLQISGAIIIEDAKGVLTPLCRWKLKHMAAQGNPVALWPPKKPTRKKKS